MSNQQLEQKAAALLVKYHRFIYRRACYHLPFRHFAEDVAQQVCVEFLSKVDQWDFDSDLRPLLGGMVRNFALRLWRERAKECSESLRQIGKFVQCEMSEDEPEADERLAVLRGCIQKMPENGRRLIIRHYFDDVSLKQLAEELQKKTDTVSKAIWRLREQLRACIVQTMKSEEYHG